MITFAKQPSTRRALRVSWLAVSAVSLLCCYLRFSLYLKSHYPNGDLIWTIATHGVITPLCWIVVICKTIKQEKANRIISQVKP